MDDLRAKVAGSATEADMNPEKVSVTAELNDKLKNVRPSKMTAFLKDNSDKMTDPESRFSEYFKKKCKEKGLKLKDVAISANLEYKRAQALLSGKKHTSSRDTIIRLCAGSHFSVEETNRALKLYNMSELYSRDGRDAVIIVDLHNRRYDFWDICEDLKREGFPSLGEEGK